MSLIDLTRPLNADTEIFRDGTYSDPALEIASWCGIDDQGYRVASLSLGTQTGTHIDAPAHFHPTGATLDGLAPEAMVGPYFHVEVGALDDAAAREARLASHRGEGILFLAAAEAGTTVSAAALEALIALDASLWVMAGSITIAERQPLEFHRRIAAAGVYLVEDLDFAAADRVRPVGTLAALPLRLEAVSGSPCRVLARCDGVPVL